MTHLRVKTQLLYLCNLINMLCIMLGFNKIMIVGCGYVKLTAYPNILFFFKDPNIHFS